MYKLYAGQSKLTFSHPRVKMQSEMIRQTLVLKPAMTSGLSITEIGCAGGELLARLAWDLPVSNLICFEADDKQHALAFRTIERYRKANSTHTFKLIKSAFDASVVTPQSVDLLASSHVVEHMHKPCEWLAGVRHMLRPGGYVFTELPWQEHQPFQKALVGQFHAAFYNSTTFNRMMAHNGFRLVLGRSSTYSTTSRKIERKTGIPAAFLHVHQLLNA